MTPPSREDFAYFYPVQLRWGDMDALGHVNNVKFFTFDESARLAFFSELMRDDARFWKDYGMILARIECDFLAQLKPPGTLDVGFRLTRLGRSSLHTEAGMYFKGQCMAITRAVVVWFDYVDNCPLPLPVDVRQRIRDASVIPPQE
jgi:acyl-CoA thioester hydrolase